MDYIWSIGIYTGSNPLSITAPDHIENPVLTAADVSDVEAKFVADPFMIYERPYWYMFFEVWNKETERGEIGLASSRDGFKWQYNRIVLRESFHLSYPYVFKSGDNYYMIPETRKAASVRLYKAATFPGKWVFVKTLLEGDFADASIFFKDRRWWMFVFLGEETLKLFYADSLQGKWNEHVKSPVISADLKVSRPGGRVLTIGERIIRIAQDGVPLYGSHVRALEVKVLDLKNYEEAEVPQSPVLKRSRRGWNAAGMHHADIHEFADGRWIACVDGATVDFPTPPRELP